MKSKIAATKATTKMRYIKLTSSRIAIANKASTLFRIASTIKRTNAMMTMSLRSTTILPLHNVKKISTLRKRFELLQRVSTTGFQDRRRSPLGYLSMSDGF